MRLWLVHNFLCFLQLRCLLQMPGRELDGWRLLCYGMGTGWMVLFHFCLLRLGAFADDDFVLPQLGPGEELHHHVGGPTLALPVVQPHLYGLFGAFKSILAAVRHQLRPKPFAVCCIG